MNTIKTNRDGLLISSKQKAKAEAGHTPGPWKIVPICRSELDIHHESEHQSGGFFCRVVALNRHTPEGLAQMEANAALVAAAPEMLAALRDLLEQVDVKCGGRCEGTSALVVAADAARAAIARAEAKP